MDGTQRIAQDAAVVKLPVKEKLSYSFGDLGSNLIFSMIGTYLMFFYTDVFGISAAAVGTLFLFARCFDAVNDPLMGTIADKTRTRWGAYRPWILRMIVPFMAMSVLMFTTPDFNPSGKLVWAWITYNLLICAYTAINIPYGVMAAVMTQDTDERARLNMWRMSGAMIGALLTGMLALPLVNALGADNPQKGYQLTILVFALVGGALFLLCFLGTRERVLPPKKKNTFREELRSLKGNRPWIILFLASILTFGALMMINGVTMYYFSYVLRQPAIIPVFLVVTTLFMLVGTILGPSISARLPSKKWMLIFGMGLSAVFLFIRYFTPSVIPLFVLTCLGNLSLGTCQGVIQSMYADSVEYGAWKNGIHAPGIVYSSLSFSQKLAMAITGAATGWLLGAFGYTAGAEQSAQTVNGINALFTIVPAILSFLAIIIVCFHDLDRKKYYEILENLKSRGIALGEKTAK